MAADAVAGGSDALSSLHEITAQIVASLDLDETLAVIARAMTQVLAADIGAIYLLDEPAGVIRLRGIHGQRSPAWAGHTMPADRGMNATAIRTGKVQRVDDYQQMATEAQAQTSVVNEEPARSVITAPLNHLGRRLGSMGAIRRQVRPFSDRDVILLQTLADHASIAVANALAYEEVASASRRLQEAHGLGLRVLLALSSHLRMAADTPSFYGRLSETIAELVRARRAAFFQWDGERTACLQPRAFGFEPGALEALVFPCDPHHDDIIERVVFGDAVFRGDVHDTDPAIAPYREQLAAMKIANAIAVAWRAGEQPLGLLVAYDSTRDAGFTEEDVLVLRTAALAAGVVSQQKRAEDRLAEQQARETAQLREHAERMAALEQTKSEFLQLASHELRSPIGVVRGYLSMFEEGSLGAADLPRVVPILSAKIQQINLLMNELLETARLEARPVALDRQPVDLRQIVQESVRIMEPLVHAGPPIDMALPSTEVPVLADEGRMETIVTNLLDNAIKYSNGTRKVACRLRVDGETAEIEVRDNGIGIDERDLPRLFQRFSRVVTRENRHTSGTGLGLYIARELARQHGGDITVSSRVGEGTSFRVTVPLRPPTAP